MQLSVKTQRPRQIIDITDHIDSLIPPRFAGLAVALVQHTSAALTTADLDPGTDLDFLDALELLIPDRPWRHPHDPQHAPDHLLASIIGPGLSLPVRDGRLQLGTWQRVVLVELSGPRPREISLTLVPAK
jgi:secondary thiamine-phosphate synthase enzyme